MTSNKDVLEVFGWGKIGDYYDANLYDAKSYDKGWEDCKKAIRNALSQPTPWRIDDSGNPVPFHTYNPETHILVAREDVPEFIKRAPSTIRDSCDRIHKVLHEALIAQKTEE